MSADNFCDLALILCEGDGSKSGYMVEAFLTYWLYGYMLPSNLEDDVNLYVFQLASLYPESLYTRLDECINNVVGLWGGTCGHRC